MRKRKSRRRKLIEKCDTLLFKYLKLKRGERCEFCGKTENLGLFHVFPKGRYPRIRYHEYNVLIAGWFCCHYKFHHDVYETKRRLYPRLQWLRDNNFEDELHILNNTAPRLTILQLDLICNGLEYSIKKLIEKQEMELINDGSCEEVES